MERKNNAPVNCGSLTAVRNLIEHYILQWKLFQSRFNTEYVTYASKLDIEVVLRATNLGTEVASDTMGIGTR